MNVKPITMDPHAARKAFLEYKRDVRGRHDAETTAILRGYRAIARGQAVLNLPQTIIHGGLDAQLRPLLAVAMASAERVYYASDPNGARFTTRESKSWNGRWEADFYWRDRRRTFHLNVGDLPPVKGIHRALVPYVPMPLRPRGALSNYLVLFEARWEPVPPTDPMLLRHLHGDLYAVVAHWNLTDLERAVMAGRLR